MVVGYSDSEMELEVRLLVENTKMLYDSRIMKYHVASQQWNRLNFSGNGMFIVVKNYLLEFINQIKILE